MFESSQLSQLQQSFSILNSTLLLGGFLETANNPTSVKIMQELQKAARLKCEQNHKV